MDGYTITVGDLKRQLASFPDDMELTFQGGLTLYRLKQRAENSVNVEFNEAQGYLSDSFKKRNPNVKVAFIDTSNVQWDKEDVIGGPIDVEVT
jgi:hypothetical protein